MIVGNEGATTRTATIRRVCAETLLRVSPRFCRLTARRFHAARPPNGLTPAQLVVLERLSDGPATPGQLARELVMQPSTITQLTDALVAQGFITRDRSGGDRREIILTITARGRASREHVWETAVTHFGDQLAHLDDDEVHRLFAALIALEMLLQRAESPGTSPPRSSRRADERSAE